MDLAYFKRGKMRFLCWMGLPPLLIAIAYGSSTLYTFRTNKAFKNRLTYLELIPNMESKLEEGKKTLADYWDESASVDSLNTALNRYANQYGLLVNSLTASEHNPRQAKPTDKLETTEFKLSARGSMISLMKFCHAVQAEHPVLTLDKSAITFTQMEPNPIYQIDLVLLHYKVKI